MILIAFDATLAFDDKTNATVVPAEVNPGSGGSQQPGNTEPQRKIFYIPRK